MQNTCHPSFQDGLTNILAQTSCHKQIRAFVCDVRGCNFEAARQLQRHKLMLTTILRRSINYGSACLRATFGRLRSYMKNALSVCFFTRFTILLIKGRQIDE